MKILEEWLISDRNPFIFYSNVFFFFEISFVKPL
jgi:hypothetical protein